MINVWEMNVPISIELPLPRTPELKVEHILSGNEHIEYSVYTES